MAIQLAHHTGARVVCTAGSAVKLGRCRELGADVLINYKDEDFVEVMRRERLAADLVLDNMGAKYLDRNLERARDQRSAGHHRPAGRRTGGARHRRADVRCGGR